MSPISASAGRLAEKTPSVVTSAASSESAIEMISSPSKPFGDDSRVAVFVVVTGQVEAGCVDQATLAVRRRTCLRGRGRATRRRP